MRKALLFLLNIQFFAEKDEAAGNDQKEQQPDLASEGEKAPTIEEILQEVKEMKANSVPKDQYERVLAERNKLVKAAIDERLPEKKEEKPGRPDIKTLKKELYGPDSHLTNMDYIQKTLQLRDAIIEEGGVDPFLPAEPSEEDRIEADKTARFFKENLEQANGSPEVFQALIQARSKDDPKIALARKQRGS